MNWTIADRADRGAVQLADRHYNRQHPGSPQFVPPGRCLVLKTEGAVWVTSWPFAEYVRHAWAGAWVNSIFRRESGPLASVLIREAVAASLWYYGPAPAKGLVTFIDRGKVRRKRDFGRCYLRAGFKYAKHKNGELQLTKGGLVVLRMMPWMMPKAEAPLLAQQELPVVCRGDEQRMGER